MFRNASNNSNGTRSIPGAPLSCGICASHRAVRARCSATIIADKYDGNSQLTNDIVAHLTAAIGSRIRRTVTAVRGAAGRGGRSFQYVGRLNPRLGQPPDLGNFKRELPNGVYRVDPSGRVDLVAGEDVMPDPNGLAFSHDHKKLYIVSFAKGPGDTGPGGNRSVYSFDVGANNKLGRATLFADFIVDGVKCAPDGIKCDVDGNLWCGSNAGRAVGYNASR